MAKVRRQILAGVQEMRKATFFFKPKRGSNLQGPHLFQVVHRGSYKNRDSHKLTQESGPEQELGYHENCNRSIFLPSIFS